VAVPCTAPFTGAVLDWAGNGIAASKSVAARERTKRIAILLGKRPGQSGALGQQLKNAWRFKQFLDPLSPRSTVVNGSHLTGLEREPQAAEGEGSILDTKCLAEHNGGLYITAETQEEIAEAFERTLGCLMISEISLSR
jgi:hypothetical protein